MIEIKDLGKEFRDGRRRVCAAEGISFTCHPGEVFGLLGPNGAGKTTILRVISTALRPTSGTGTIAGYDLVRDSTEVRRRIGFLSSNTGLYGRLTPRETLRYFGSLNGMTRTAIDERIHFLARRFQIEEFLDRPCDKLSTGMRQKVNIARTILHDPPVIILDEPTAGLDVITSRAIIDFIRESRSNGRTVLFSSHVMDEVRRLCDRIAILHMGKLLFLGTLADFREAHPGDLEDAFLHTIEGATTP